MKTYLLLIFLTLFSMVNFDVQAKDDAPGITEASDQQILKFDLSGFGDKGKKTWDVQGKSADIFSNTIRLNDIVAKVYGEEDNVKITADSGLYDKGKGEVHLQDNVVITTDSGAKLLTDSLDWQQETRKVSTPDDVDITRENLKVVGKGIEAEPDLKKVKLNDDIKVDIQDANFSFAGKADTASDAQDKQPITITCEGPLNIDYETQVAIFNKNVVVTHSQGQMFADKMTVTFDTKTKSINEVECVGNVKILNGDNTTYSEKAVYIAQDKKIVLTGRPRLVIYSDSSMAFTQ